MKNLEEERQYSELSMKWKILNILFHKNENNQAYDKLTEPKQNLSSCQSTLIKM
jgi:hypothetical protein